jgi:hypothetical protein
MIDALRPILYSGNVVIGNASKLLKEGSSMVYEGAAGGIA